MNPMKRARTEYEDVEQRELSSSSSSADYYYAVLSETDTGILSSWFRVMQWTGRDLDNVSSKDNESLQDLQLEIQQLSRQLIEIKRRMHASSSDNYWDARRASNPYEFLGEGREGGLNSLFMNRSAIKLANLDALLDWELTQRQPHDNFGPFRFVDLCGAPGGFSEYIMRRCVNLGIHECHGFGMSLSGVNEYGTGVAWKIDDFCERQQRTKLRYHVCPGSDGTGDILNWSNVQHLKTTVAADSETCKVHLVVADGGFDAQRNAQEQEGMTQKLIVCEVAAALELLDVGGTLVVKLFGFQTPVVQCVLGYLHASFERMIALKPISSRPASAERYVVFANFRGNHSADFDGQRWMNKMFLGPSALSNIPTEPLDLYLSEFDRNMLALNLKACYAMLSFMKTDASDTPELFVDADDYRLCWRLM